MPGMLTASLDPIAIDDVPIALSTASEHLNEIDDIDIVKVTVHDDTYAQDTESQNAKSNITAKQFNEIDNAKKPTNDERYTAKEQLHVITNATSTTNEITNEQLDDIKNATESMTKEIAKDQFNDIKNAKASTIESSIYDDMGNRNRNVYHMYL